MSKQPIYFALVLIIVIIFGTWFFATNSAVAPVKSNQLVLHVPETGQARCDVTTPKYIPLPTSGTADVTDFALKNLFAEGMPNIQPFYKGVTVKDGVAIVDFSAEALRYLNGSPCMQQSYKVPISRTLLELGIKEVKYLIGGTIFTAWDA